LETAALVSTHVEHCCWPYLLDPFDLATQWLSHLYGNTPGMTTTASGAPPKIIKTTNDDPHLSVLVKKALLAGNILVCHMKDDDESSSLLPACLRPLMNLHPFTVDNKGKGRRLVGGNNDDEVEEEEEEEEEEVWVDTTIERSILPAHLTIPVVNSKGGKLFCVWCDFFFVVVLSDLVSFSSSHQRRTNRSCQYFSFVFCRPTTHHQHHHRTQWHFIDSF
jgi:hypothetical protein